MISLRVNNPCIHNRAQKKVMILPRAKNNKGTCLINRLRLKDTPQVQDDPMAKIAQPLMVVDGG